LNLEYTGSDVPPDWVVAATEPRMAAEILRAALETAGIPVHLMGETIGHMLGLTAVELGEVDVLVPSTHLREAQELIRDSHPMDFPEGD
jgi:hypothetical protein